MRPIKNSMPSDLIIGARYRVVDSPPGTNPYILLEDMIVAELKPCTISGCTYKSICTRNSVHYKQSPSGAVRMGICGLNDGQRRTFERLDQ